MFFEVKDKSLIMLISIANIVAKNICTFALGASSNGPLKLGTP